MAVVWAAVWLPIGLALGWYAGTSSPQPSDVIHRPVSLPSFLTAWTAWGGLSGGVFALVLSSREARRRLEELSLIRTAVWGALGAITLPAVLTLVDVLRTPVGLRGYTWRFPFLLLVVSAVLGAGCASVTLAAARRGVPRPGGRSDVTA